MKYKNTVITAGTGSGKTESFLLPLFANIFLKKHKAGGKPLTTKIGTKAY
ncbi:MAG: hypothetical protein L6U16_07895 [Porphyromonadaceae bacterium]|nr:MAG: hypothetical protein L6U16_07895 [Porphyromonadaceae bacterium]